MLRIVIYIATIPFKIMVPITLPEVINDGCQCFHEHFCITCFLSFFFLFNGEPKYFSLFISFFLLFFPFIFISWRLITLQYCSGFCHTLT